MKLPYQYRRHRAFTRLRAAIRQHTHLVLSFHSIGHSLVADFLPHGLSCDKAFFEETLQLLHQETRVLPLCELVESSSVRGVALTFDDGFRDTFTVAFPLLRQYKFPATLFAVTQSIDTTELLPLHRYYFAQKHGGVFALPTDSPARRKQVEDFLRTRQLVVPPLGRELYLCREELQTMAEGGFEIGAHTCTHPFLASLSEAEQRHEIITSKHQLEKWLGKSIESFAFPYGYGSSVNATTTDIVADHFRVACLSGPPEPWQHGPLWCARKNIMEFLY
jgi:peptidoglycan/xylan/chitin deacetylase (PgdA/CDA1 family)